MIISSFSRRMALQSAVLCSFMLVIIGGQRIPSAEPQKLPSQNLLSSEEVMHVRISQSVPRHLCRRAIRNTQVMSIIPYISLLYEEEKIIDQNFIKFFV